jgi:hypothetical protein
MIGKPVFLGMVVCTLVIGLLVGRQIMATNGALDSKDAPSSSEVAEAMTRVDYSKYQHDLASVEDGLVGVADTLPAGGGEHPRDSISEQSEEWLQFERRGAFVQLLVRGKNGRGVDASLMYRNTDLNPSDIELSPAHRGIIHALAQAFRDDVKKYRGMQDDVQEREFKALMDSGATRNATYDSYVAGLDYRDKKMHNENLADYRADMAERLKAGGLTDDDIAKSLSRPVYQFDSSLLFGRGVLVTHVTEDGVLHCAKYEDLPKTKEFADLRAQSAFAFAQKTGAIFCSAGALPASSLETLLADAYERLFSN